MLTYLYFVACIPAEIFALGLILPNRGRRRQWRRLIVKSKASAYRRNRRHGLIERLHVAGSRVSLLCRTIVVSEEPAKVSDVGWVC